MIQTVLITGAAGYIGSHFVEELLESKPDFLKGAKLVWVDDLSSGQANFIEILSKLAIANGFPNPTFCKVDLLDREGLRAVFETHKPDAVFHFAAKISVAESVARPDYYFENNVTGSKNLLDAMRASACKRLVFSSTAAVYGKVDDPKLANRPLAESTSLKPINPYGKTKLMMEEAIQNAATAWGLEAVIFRYFNAAGASLSGRLGECHDPETHLIPLIIRAAISGQKVQVFGIHYETRDGSCIRDYVHVKDLASAHLLGLRKLIGISPGASPDDGDNSVMEPSSAERSSTLIKANSSPQISIFNLGTERGSSVLEVIDAAEIVIGKPIARDIHPNRAGDSAILIADASLARLELGWSSKHSSMRDILKSVLHWEINHHARSN
jgi:UDP-glucose 4-epimerase